MRSLLDFAPPLPPPPPLQTLAPPASSYNPSIIIITATIFLVIIASAAVHFLLRFLSRRSASLPELPLSSTSSPPSTPSPPPMSAAKDPVSSLPLFSLAAALPKTSADCAVCLSAFRPHDELRLLPACRHAFHATCIDTWLRSTSSCPLCRAAVVLPFPQPSAPPEAASASASASTSTSRSGSFRIEIGSISRRQSLPGADPAAPPPDRLSYSLGSSFEYVVEEEVEAFLDRVLRRVPEKDRKPEAPPPPPPPPQAEAAAVVALADAVGGNSRGWLRDYVDRISSSSFWWSGRSSQRFDDGGVGGGAADGGGDWGFEGEESGMFSNFSRWLWGPHPNT